MTHVRDTFLKYLHDNLSTLLYDGINNIVINPVRASEFQSYEIVQKLNAVNVEFLGINFAHSASQQVAIDIMYDSEIEAENVMYLVWDLFKSSFYIPLYDYTNPSSPVAINQKSLSWEPGRVYFRKLPRSEYAHYNCILELRFSL